MVKIQFFPLDISYKVIENRASIFIFGRTLEGKRVVVVDNTFKPYFYISFKEGSDIDVVREKLESMRGTENNLFFSIIKTFLEKKFFNGIEKDFIRVIVNQPMSIPIIKEKLAVMDEIDDIFETDISFIRKYIIEKGLIPYSLYSAEGNETLFRGRVDIAIEASVFKQESTEFPTLRVLSLLVNTKALGRDETESEPICSIAVQCQNFKSLLFLEAEKGRIGILIEHSELFLSEGDLLRRFFDLVNHLKPDIICGYDSDTFDLAKILSRAKHHNIRFDVSLDVSEPINYHGNIQSVKLTGISHIDLKKSSMGLFREFLSIDSKHIRRLNDTVEKSFNSLGDTKNPLLVVESLYYMGLIYLSYLFEISKIIKLPLFDISRISQNQFVEWYIINQAKELNHVLPNRSKEEDVTQDTQTIQNPIFVKGIYDLVLSLDIKWVFLSVLSTYNISEETKNCSCCKDIAVKVPGYEGLWFCRKKEGFIPKLIGETLSRKQRIREILRSREDENLKIRHDVLEVLLGSFKRHIYSKGSRWRLSEEIQYAKTLTNTHLNKLVDLVEKNEFRAIFSDANTILISGINKNKDDFNSLFNKILLELTVNFEISQKSFFKKAILISSKGEFTSKPRYALLDMSSNIMLYGFESQRSNYSNIAKSTQEEVLRVILIENNITKALKFLNDTVMKIKRKEILAEDFIFSITLQKDIGQYNQVTPHIAAAQRLKSQGKEVYPGLLVSFVIVSGNEPLRERVRLPTECQDCIFDAEYYINRQVIPSVEQIFSVFHIPKELLLETKDQKKLGSFF